MTSTSRLRIAITCQLVQLHRFGVGNCIAELCSALSRLADPDQLCFYLPSADAERKLPGIAPEQLRAAPSYTRFRALRILWEQTALERAAFAAGASILHSPGYVQPVLSAVRRRIRTVVTLYDVFALSHPELCRRLTVLHYGLLLGASARQADRVIVPSRSVAHEVSRWLGVPERKIVCIPPGIAPGFRRVPSEGELRDIRARYRLHEPFLLFAGNAEPRKNLGRLVHAYARLRDQGFEPSLVVAGGRSSDNLRSILDRPGIRAIGYVPSEDLPLLMREARAVLLPSLVEGFGLPVIEAMACGTPAVCSPVPALLETDADAAFLVDPLSQSSLMDGIRAAHEDEGRRADVIQRGRCATAAKTWERAACRTWQVYEELESARH